ncbi:hypothetical protein QVD17_35607 [Tagetes erecta]|uniref:DNA-binding protein BIN4 n=1 Tax=Tagetes erecta TaxID=13708 RepID=A0AAD8NHD0_TARER|nr:hypothetical protein QVD17_35607 [Tagetes erecta]
MPLKEGRVYKQNQNSNQSIDSKQTSKMSRSSSSSRGGRDYSPDWLRNHQAPSSSIWTLSSSSSSSDDDDDQLPISSVKQNNSPHLQPPPAPVTNTNDDDDDDEEAAETVVSQRDNNTTDDKQNISSSTLPLLLADKLQRSKVLVECEGESIDLSGDLGSVGRVVISDSHQDMLFDLKGTIYKTTIMPSTTFCLVSFGQSEAKIEAIMNDFVQLNPQSNVYEAETMVEGTLEGFSFDSEDEDDKHAATRQTDENEPQTNREASKKKGRIAVKKPSAKKVTKKKPPVAKKTKARK